jgi:hypothetical protein
MAIDATERLHRTIGVGLAYNTSQGVAPAPSGKTATYSGMPNTCAFSAEVGQQIDAFRANFRRPDFLALKQTFLATAEIANDTPVAYHSQRELATAGLERHFGRLLTGASPSKSTGERRPARECQLHCCRAAHPALRTCRRAGLCKTRHDR